MNSKNKSILTYSIESHESPQKDGDLLVKWYDVQTVWQVCSIGINDILEIFGESFVQWVQVHPAVDDPQKPEELIWGEVLDNLRLQLLIDLVLLLGRSTACARFHGAPLHHKILEHLVERDVAASYQEIEIVVTGRLVFNQDQQEVDREGDQHLLLSTLINCTEIWHAIPWDIIWYNNIDQADKQVLAILGSLIREVCAEWVQNQEIFIGCIEQWLAEYGNEQPEQIDSILIVLVHAVVDGSWHTDATSPDHVFIDTVILGWNTIRHWLYCEALLE